MSEIRWYMLIGKEKVDYLNAPEEVNEAAEAAYRQEYDEHLEANRGRDRLSEIDAEAHLYGTEAANRVWEKWFAAAKKENRDLEYTLEAIPQSQVVLLEDINEELLRCLAHHPKTLYDLTSRKFEELIAKILKDFGFDVELTKTTRDGGVDLYAYLKNRVSDFLVLVECKKYSPDNSVGVDIVRQLYGVQEAQKANKSLIVTTSFFTKPAQDFRKLILSEMDLKDYDDLKVWLENYIEINPRAT
jgi:restriction endonuclease Mrr